jgi:hypothetical protein
MMNKQEAERAAAKLLRRMGPGWKPRIWENLGWHFEVHTDDGTPFGRLHVFGSDEGWHALLNADGQSVGGNSAWCPPWGPDPVAVAKAALALAKKEMEGINALLDVLPVSFGGRAP